MIFGTIALMASTIDSWLRPSVVWLLIWYMSPKARVPSPYSPRTAWFMRCAALNTWSMFSFSVSAGRCTITLARMPVPTLVGQAVR